LEEVVESLEAFDAASVGFEDGGGGIVESEEIVEAGGVERLGPLGAGGVDRGLGRGEGWEEKEEGEKLHECDVLMEDCLVWMRWRGQQQQQQQIQKQMRGFFALLRMTSKDKDNHNGKCNDNSNDKCNGNSNGNNNDNSNGNNNDNSNGNNNDNSYGSTKCRSFGCAPCGSFAQDDRVRVVCRISAKDRALRDCPP
jgi:hypothetical protein